MQGFYDAGETIAPVTTSHNFGDATECGEKPTTPPTPKPKPTATTKPTSPNVNLTANKGSDINENVAMCRSTRGASLNWGVKQSFSDYVTGPIANGSIQRANGVSGSFNWPCRTANFDPDKGTGQCGFGCTLAFSGHDAALYMTISNPRVQIVSSSQ